MNAKMRYVYFSLTRRQMRLLLAALLRNLARISQLGKAASALQRAEANSTREVHDVLEKIDCNGRDNITVTLSEHQFAIVSIAVKTTCLVLSTTNELKLEYDELMQKLNAHRLSRRTPTRDEGIIQGVVKI